MPETAKLMRTSAVYIAIFFIATIVTSCNKQNDETNMNMVISPTAIEYTMPIIASIEQGTNLGEIEVTYDLEALIKNQNGRFSTSNITSLKLSTFSLVLDTAFTGNSYSNIESIGLTIGASVLTQSPLLASTTTIDSEPTVITRSLNLPLTATDNNLKSYLTGSAVKFILTGKLRRLTTVALKGKATATFKVSLSL